MNVLDDAAYSVVPVAPASQGVAWLRAHVARFSEGADHVRRRRLVDDLLLQIDPRSLHRSGSPTANLAAALGLERDAAMVDDVAAVARSYQPHAEKNTVADDAVARLVDRFGGTWNELTAARISVLVQAHDATNAMIAGKWPPVSTTRRLDPYGNEVIVDLTDMPFGAGRHACPGQVHARAMVAGAHAFFGLHDGPSPFVLPNAWDVGSAYALVAAGFAAVGTTSLGVAAARGIPDAAGLAGDSTIELAARLAVLPVPVTVDIEYGFGLEPSQLACELSTLGIAGINIEDGRTTGLADPIVQAAIISEFKRAAPEMFVNARVDTYWLDVDHRQTLARSRRYVEAGADGIFIPGLADPYEIERLAGSLRVPLNLLAGLPLRQLADLGVRRVSTGSLLYRTALHNAITTAVDIRDGATTGTPLSYAEVQRWTGHHQ
jgi:2-methylisocitrate lyase-like PEP mutase family enzyme